MLGARERESGPSLITTSIWPFSVLRGMNTHRSGSRRGGNTIELELHGLRERCSCLHKVSVVSSGICGPGMGAFSGEPENGAAAWYFAYPNY